MSLRELVRVLPCRVLRLPSISVMEMKSRADETSFSLSIIFSDLHKPVLRYQHFLDVCRRQLVTSLRWPLRWVPCKSALLLPTEGRLLLYRRFTFLQMT